MTSSDIPSLRKIRLARKVIRRPELSALARLVFVDLLLGYHNTKTGLCNPGADTIGKGLGRNGGRIEKAIVELLRSSGELTRKRRRAGTPLYGFPGLDRSILTGLEQDQSNSFARDQSNSAARDQSKSAARNTVKSKQEKAEPKICETHPVDDVQVEREALSLTLSDAEIEKAFEVFWAQCARRVAKGKARDLYFEVVREGKAMPAQLLQAMVIYAAARGSADARFTKTPATWLAQECWHDDPAAIAPVSAWHAALGELHDSIERRARAAAGPGCDSRGGTEFATADREKPDGAAMPQDERPKEDERWLRVRAKLETELSSTEFKRFAETRCEGLRDRIVTLRASAPIDARTIKQRYEPRLLALWEIEAPEVLGIDVKDRYGDLATADPLLRTGTA